MTVFLAAAAYQRQLRCDQIARRTEAALTIPLGAAITRVCLTVRVGCADLARHKNAGGYSLRVRHSDEHLSALAFVDAFADHLGMHVAMDERLVLPLAVHRDYLDRA